MDADSGRHSSKFPVGKVGVAYSALDNVAEQHGNTFMATGNYRTDIADLFGRGFGQQAVEEFIRLLLGFAAPLARRCGY
jgi:hypothetical protein